MTDLAASVFTVAETAALFRVSSRTMYAAIHRGEVPAVRIGRRLVVPGAQIARLLEMGGDAMSDSDSERPPDGPTAVGQAG